MALFDQILSAVDNPSQQASTGQIGGILQAAQQLSSGYGTNPSATQTAMSVVGNYVRSALRQKQAEAGNEQAQAFVNHYSGTGPNPRAVQDLFSQGQQQQVVQDTAQRAGLNPSTIQAMLPVLVPLVLNFLHTGSNAHNPRGGSNSVLNAFLDADHDGAVDIGDAMGLAGQFLNQRR